MKTSLLYLFLLLSHNSFAAIVQMRTGFDVAFSQLNSFPTVDIDQDDPVIFALIYSSQTLSSVLEPTRAVYNILGSASVEIGAYTWSTSSFELEIWDDLDVLTPTDEITFRAQMDGPTEFEGQLADVSFSFSSFSSDLSFITATSLPTDLSQVNFGALESSGFQLIQEVGTSPTWLISGGDYTEFSINTIPEPSSSILCIIPILGILRRNRT